MGPGASLRSFALVLCAGCAGVPLPRTEEGVAGIPVAGYRLVWSDEFEGRVLDPTKWRHHRPGPRRAAVNVPEAARLDGEGRLVLTTSKVGNEWRTAMIATKGLFERAFGYFECRVLLQTQVGHWSAFWLQTPTMGKYVGNPARAGAEIDVFEYLRREGDRVHHTVHWDGYGEDHKSTGTLARVPGLSSGWHRFGLLWTPDRYVFYVDGKATWRTRNGISKRPEYMILSLEVGDWAGDIRKAALPDSLLVDWVRVYAEDPSSPSGTRGRGRGSPATAGEGLGMLSRIPRRPSSRR